MRGLIAGLGATLVMVGTITADAQRGPGASYPVLGRGPIARPLPNTVTPAVRRWQTRGGRWVGGYGAPGGWSGYRQPYLGYALPRYWVQPAFAIGSWSGYGLAQPPRGYRWSRYYDDAVLIDAQGSVHDIVSGVDWDGDADRYDFADADDVPVAPDYDRRGDRQENGLGGAAIGAVAGGVAGNLIAGRGDRLGGTLIGAGTGAAAGYAIDKAEDRGRRPVPGYGAGYPPLSRGYAPPHGHAPHGGRWVSPDGTTTVVTSAGGYGYGGTTTTVVVQGAPVTTTTTTEYLDDHVTYSNPAKRKVIRRRWRPIKTVCRC